MPILCNMVGLKRMLLCVGGLLLATGGPITLFTTSDLVGGLKRSWLANPAATATAASHQTAAATTEVISSQPAIPASAAMAPSDAAPMPSLAEVLRFDVSVPWVMQRWPRVSTGLPCLQLQGYRVPLVTGTKVTDLAGSLTYYFDARQQAQRITFRGTTGDPSALMVLLTSRYHFARRVLNDPGLMLYEAVDSSNQPVGSVKIRSATVINANQPYSRFEVELLMDRAE
jgi:hypothetical protein